MLTVHVAGRGYHRDASGQRDLVAGTVGLVAGGDPGVLWADPDQPYQHAYCRFGGGYALSLVPRICQRQGGQFFSCDDCDRWFAEIRRIGPLQRASLPTTMGRAEAVLVGILVDLLGEGPGEERFSAETLDGYLQRTLDGTTDLAAIANHFRVSVSTLTRRARTWFGCGVQARHEAHRLAWAQTLLRETTAPVALVARRVGYHDPGYFARVFRRRHGLPPGRWRRGNGA